MSGFEAITETEYLNGRHALTNIDEFQRTATCSVCGYVQIHRSEHKVGWRCAPNQVEAARPYRKHVGDTCSRCGFIPEHHCQLDVHHKDGNRKNNDPDNLTTLCANCHRLDRVGLLS